MNEMGVKDRVGIFSAKPFGENSAAIMVRDHWDLEALELQYASFIKSYEKLLTNKVQISDHDAFLIRYAIVIDFLKISWCDSGLPEEFLPKNWLGTKATNLAATLYKKFLPKAKRHAINLGLAAVQVNSNKRNK